MGRLDYYRKLPVFKKADEILELAEIIVEAIKEDEKKDHLAREILSNAMMIGAKIAGATGGNLYSLRMQKRGIDQGSCSGHVERGDLYRDVRYWRRGLCGPDARQG